MAIVRSRDFGQALIDQGISMPRNTFSVHLEADADSMMVLVYKCRVDNDDLSKIAAALEAMKR
jgi:hypothetical protein